MGPRTLLYGRTSPAPRGGIPEPCPPKWLLVPPTNENCAPPSEDCAPKKLTGSGLLECISRPETPNLVFTASIFVIFVDSHRISLHFSDDEELFFWSYLVRLIHTGINFWCPSRLYLNKLLVPPQNLFLPLQSHYSGAGPRNFFFYHGFADLLRHILCPNLQFHTPLSILTWSALFIGNLVRWYWAKLGYSWVVVKYPWQW